MKSKLLSVTALALALTLGLSSTAMAGQSKYFVDVNDNNYGWSVEYVDYLCEKGIASGTGQNKYSPELNIKRGDFIILIDKAFNLKPVLELSVSFSDVSSEMYYYQSIINAKGNGIIKDFGVFNPETPITRVDAMTMLYRAMSLENMIKTTGSTDLSMFADGDIIKDIEAKNAIGTLAKIGVVNGSDGYLKPLSTISRAEMAVIFSKALQYAEENSKPAEIEVDEPVTDNTDDENTTLNSKEFAVEEVVDATLTDTLYMDNNPCNSAENISAVIKENTSAGSVIEVNNQTKASINNSKLSVLAENENVIKVTDDSSLELTNSEIKAIGKNQNGVLVENGSKLSIDNASFLNMNDDTYALTNGGDAEITNSKFESKPAKDEECSLVRITDNSNTEITNTSFISDDADGIFLVTPGEDSEEDYESELTVKDCSFEGKKAALFKFDGKTDFKATIEDCKFDSLTNLFVNNFSHSNQSKLPTLDLTLKNQEIEINLDTAALYEATINLEGKTHLTGMCNDNNFPHYLKINIGSNCVWELTSDVYISSLDLDDRSFFTEIIDNGYNIYYDATLDENNWLHEDTYDLPYGGQIMPK